MWRLFSFSGWVSVDDFGELSESAIVLEMNRASHITQLRISGMRVIEDVTLDLDGLTVLIGDNGTGKSSILEALELLRQASFPGSFTQDVIGVRHGEFQSLLRRGAKSLRLGCRVRTYDGTEMDYDLELQGAGGMASVESERASILAKSPQRLTLYTKSNDDTIANHELALPKLARLHPLMGLLQEALESIAVHIPFEARAFRRQEERGRGHVPRELKTNLADAFQKLRNQGSESWERVIWRMRLGINPNIRDLYITTCDNGNSALEIVFDSELSSPMPVEWLSDGELAYLAMIARCGLSSDSSLLILDDPERHLHPALAARVVFMMEDLSESVPVVLSTHSDRLLDCLADPANSVVLCALDERGVTVLRRPNKHALASWLENYRGLGAIRAEGCEAHVFDDEPVSAPSSRSSR